MFVLGGIRFDFPVSFRVTSQGFVFMFSVGAAAAMHFASTRLDNPGVRNSNIWLTTISGCKKSAGDLSLLS